MTNSGMINFRCCATQQYIGLRGDTAIAKLFQPLGLLPIMQFSHGSNILETVQRHMQISEFPRCCKSSMTLWRAEFFHKSEITQRTALHSRQDGFALKITNSTLKVYGSGRGFYCSWLLVQGQTTIINWFRIKVFLLSTFGSTWMKFFAGKAGMEIRLIQTAVFTAT